MGLKIGVFADSYHPYTSGVVRSIETFSAELRAAGHEVYIFAPEYPTVSKKETEAYVFRFPSVTPPTNHDFAIALPISMHLHTTLKKINPDIIHVHSPFILGRLGAYHAKRLNIPLVFTFHTLYDQYAHYVPIGQNLTKLITKKFCTEFCKYCDLVIVPTDIIGKHLKSWDVTSSIKTLPTGIDIDSFKITDKNWLYRQYAIDPIKKILISVGRLGKEKNFDFMLKAFQIINQRCPDTQLVLVGDGPEKEALCKLADKLKITEKIIFTGTLTKEDTALAYNSAHIFVFASVTETQGLVIGEAKAAGLPTVAVNAFGASEMVANGIDGWLSELDIQEFADKTCYLLNDDQAYQRMSIQATNNAEAISAHNCTLKLLDYYYALMEKR